MADAGLQGVPGFVATIEDDALDALVRNYCRESGVRSLEKHIEKIARKIAFNAVDKQEQAAAAALEPEWVTVTASNLEEFVGKPKYAQDTIYDCGSQPLPVGVVMGLAWVRGAVDAPYLAPIWSLSGPLYSGAICKSPYLMAAGARGPVGPRQRLPLASVSFFACHLNPRFIAQNPLGGSPCFIETAAIPVAPTEGGGGVNVITGQLGSVMKESVNIAYTFARQFVAERQPQHDFFKRHQLHLHVPEGAVEKDRPSLPLPLASLLTALAPLFEGAVEKDGPSAGVAMACSLISVATARPLRAHVAMTGELSLTGKVLPIGGVKEKTLAARRSGATTVILPFANKRDFDDLPTYVKDSVQAHFVKDFEEVFRVAFDEGGGSDANDGAAR